MSLTTNLASPQVVGTPITFFATSAWVINPVYRFWLYDGTSWTLVRDWGFGTSYTWTPSTAGSYQVGVWVKPGTTPGDVFVATRVLPFVVTPTVTLTAAPISPQVVGTPITLAATSTGVTSPVYRFWLYDGTSWTLVRDWGTGDNYTWTPSTAGSYKVGVWVKPSTTPGDVSVAYGNLPFVVTPPTVALIAAPGSPQVVGTPITLAATSTGVTSPVYRFWLYDGTSWTLVRDWGTGDNYTWTPSTAGSYKVGVWVKPSTTPGDVSVAYGNLPFVVTPPTVALIAAPGSPQVVGTPINVTAAVTGGIAPQQCKWWRSTTTWQMVQDWGACSTPWVWTPTTPGSYQVGVWVRSAGNGADTPEAIAVLPFTATPMVVTLTAIPSAPQAVGTPITVTAILTGGAAPQQCKWWLSTTTWQMVQDWGACSTPWVWTPTTPGSYQVGVWVRSAGNGADTPEAIAVLPFAVTP